MSDNAPGYYDADPTTQAAVDDNVLDAAGGTHG